MGFDNPVVGGNTLIRQAIQSPNYQPGTTGQGQGWAIKEDGSAEFNNLTTSGTAGGSTATYDDITANNTFTYQGTELTDLLNQLPRGVVASGVFLIPAGSVTTTTATLGGLTFVGDSTRMYKMVLVDVTYDNSPQGFGLGADLQIIIDGVLITHVQELGGSVGDSLGKSYVSYANQPGGPVITDGQHTLNVNIVAQGATTLTMIQHHVTVVVEDIGLIPPDTSFTGNIPPNPVQSHSFTMNALHSASYQGGGAQSNGSGADIGDRMYFGEDPGFSPNGNWRSYAWFNNSNISNMAGFQSCSKFNLTVNIPWWYQVAGGTLYVGYHNDNSGSPPGSEPASHAYQLVSAGFTARGQTKTISLLGNATIMNAVKAGTFKGIILGPGPTTSFNYYGYGEGSDHGLPQISATYLK